MVDNHGPGGGDNKTMKGRKETDVTTFDPRE